MKYFLPLLALMLFGCEEPTTTPTYESSASCFEGVLRPDPSPNRLDCPSDTLIVNDKQPGYFLCKCKTKLDGGTPNVPQ